MFKYHTCFVSICIVIMLNPDGLYGALPRKDLRDVERVLLTIHIKAY